MNIDAVLPLLPGTSADVASALRLERTKVAKYLYKQAFAGRVRRIGFRKVSEKNRVFDVVLWDRPLPLTHQVGRAQPIFAFDDVDQVEWLRARVPELAPGQYTTRVHVDLDAWTADDEADE